MKTLTYLITLIKLRLGLQTIRYYTVKDNSFSKCIEYTNMKPDIRGKTLRVIGKPFDEVFSIPREHLNDISCTFILGQDIKTGLRYKVVFEG